MIRTVIAAILILVGIAGGPLGAQTVIAVTGLDERLDPQAFISGSRRIQGVVARGDFDQGLGGATGGFALRAKAGQICMRYSSRNGLYAATQTFATKTDGWVTVPFATAYAARLRSLPGGGFSVLAELAPTCAGGSTARQIAPVARPDATTRSRPPQRGYYLVAQSGRNPAWILIAPPAKAAPVKQQCLPIEATGLIAFDTKCPLPDQAFLPGARTTLLILMPDGSQLREELALAPR